MAYIFQPGNPFNRTLQGLGYPELRTALQFKSLSFPGLSLGFPLLLTLGSKKAR